MIKVCEHCSNVDVEALIQAVGEESVKIGCLEACAKYDTEAYGFIDDELVVEHNSSDWIEKAKNL